MSGGLEVVAADGWGKVLEDPGHGVPQGLEGARSSAAETGLELGEGHLDRVEVGAVRRWEPPFRTGPFDGGPHARNPMGGQVV